MNADIKLHFEDDLDFQISAVAAVVDLFAGQEINRSEFTVSHREAETNQGTLGLVESQLGIGNKLALLDGGLQEPPDHPGAFREPLPDG